MEHLEEGTIHAWLDGALSPNEAEAVERHVATCATCSAAVAEARGFIAASSRILAALDDAPGSGMPGTVPVHQDATPLRPATRPVPRRSRYPLYAAAATLLIAIGSITINRVRNASPVAGDAVSEAEADAVREVAPTMAPPAPSPAPTVAATEPAAKGAASARPRSARARDQVVLPSENLTAGATQSRRTAPQPVLADSASRALLQVRAPERDASNAARKIDSSAKVAEVAGVSPTRAQARQAAPAPVVARPMTMVAGPDRMRGVVARAESRAATPSDLWARFVGCYDATLTPAAGTPDFGPGLPARFTLDTTPAPAIDTERAQRSGFAASAAVGSASWVPTSPTSVTVTWAMTDGRRYVMSVIGAEGTLRGTVLWSAAAQQHTAAIELRRVPCA
jgi:anti-sigma factor RsiW